MKQADIKDPYKIKEPQILVTIFRESDASTLSKVFDSFFTLFYNNFKFFAYKYYYIREEQDVHDAFTDGLVDFYRKLKIDGFEEKGATVETLLTTFCKNKLLAKFRSSKKRYDKIIDTDPSLIDENISKLEDLNYSEIKAREAKMENEDEILGQALKQVGERCKNLLIWRKKERKSNEEIALLTHIDADKVTYEIFKCSEKLKKIKYVLINQGDK